MYSREDFSIKVLLDNLPPEVAEHIKLQLPEKMGLFAQTSSYWRSYHYRKQLKSALKAQDDETQEKLLTDLLINHTLLFKEGCVADIPRWLELLFRFVNSAQVNNKNKLLATGLSLILNKDHTEIEKSSFKALLKNLCFNPNTPTKHKNGYYFSLLELTHPGVYNTLRFNTIIDPAFNSIESLQEARLILSTVFSLDRSFNTDHFFQLIGLFSKAGNSEQAQKNYFYLTHALLTILPKKHPFWLNWRDSFLRLTDCFPQQTSDTIHYHDVNAARIDVLVTLIKHLPINTNEDPWLDKTLDTLDGLTQDEVNLLTTHNKAKAIALLKNDEGRIYWLKDTIPTLASSRELFPFARRICSQLETDSAKKQLIQFILTLFQKEIRDEQQRIYLNTLLKFATLSIQADQTQKEFITEKPPLHLKR